MAGQCCMEMRSRHSLSLPALSYTRSRKDTFASPLPDSVVQEARAVGQRQSMIEDVLLHERRAGRECRVLRHQVCDHSRDVGGRHAGAGQPVDHVGRADPGADDVDAGRVQVDASASVGEGGPLPRDVDGADADRAALHAAGRGWGGTAGVLALVAGGNADVQAGGDRGRHGLVDGGDDAAGGEGHGEHGADEARALRLLAGFMLLDHEVDASDDVRAPASAVGVEALNTEDVGIRGHTEDLAASGSGDVRSVAIHILEIRGVVAPDHLGSTAEDVVFEVDASIEDVDIRACAEIAVRESVGVVQVTVAAVVRWCI